MRLILRDDDVNFYTDPKILDWCYKEFWDKTPIHLAVIPYIYCGDRPTPVDLQEYNYKDISDNEPLVKYLNKLKKENKIKIWQHGLSHKNEHTCFELEKRGKERLYGKLKFGREIMDTEFSQMTNTLVAPHDRFSKDALFAARQVGFTTICRGYSPLPREFALRDIKNYLKLAVHYVQWARTKRYPKPLKFNGLKQIFSYRIQEFTLKNYKEIIKFHLKGTLCITMHHKTFTQYHREMLRLILKEAEVYI